MKYQFNPHQHVKIWISKNPDSFLNFENQNRLIKMRALNPSDTINLVYAESLLNEKARQELRAFCGQYKTKPVSIEQDILPKCTTEREKELTKFYQYEIDRLNGGGGNPAAASDILRWLGPIYRLGAYSDFDVNISTMGLEPIKEVNAPLLFNLGSVRLFSNQLGILNNDVIAIVDEKAALQKIEQVQDSILNAYTNHKGDFSFAAYTDTCLKELSGLMPSFIIRFLERILDSFCKAAQEVNRLQVPLVPDSDSRWFTPADIRASLKAEKETQPFIFAKRALRTLGLDERGLYEDNYTNLAGKRYRQYLHQKTGLLSWATLPRQQYQNLRARLKLSNEQLYKLMAQEVYTSLYMQTVIGSTGPTVIMMALFRKAIFDGNTIHQDLANYSMAENGLSSYFQLDNGLPMDSSVIYALTKLSSTDSPGQVGDLSWVELGEKSQQFREETIKKQFEDNLKELPHNFSQLAKDIKAHREQIESQLNGCFSFYRNKARHAKINALDSILNHFEDNRFNVNNFYAALNSYRTQDIEAAFGKSATKELIDRCEVFCNKAIFSRIESVRIDAQSDVANHV